jgi:hypothetical protein
VDPQVLLPRGAGLVVEQVQVCGGIILMTRATGIFRCFRRGSVARSAVADFGRFALQLTPCADTEHANRLACPQSLFLDWAERDASAARR